MELLVIHNGNEISQRDTIISLLYLKSYLMILSLQNKNGFTFSQQCLEGGYCQFNLSGEEIAVVTRTQQKEEVIDIESMIDKFRPNIVLCSSEMFQALNNRYSSSIDKYADDTISVKTQKGSSDVEFASEFIQSLFIYLNENRSVPIPREVTQSDFKSYLKKLKP